ncbi:MAG: hypothetical protein ABFD75_14560 [Smithella sp.]
MTEFKIIIKGEKLKTATYYLKIIRENPDGYVTVDMATNAILAHRKGFFVSEDRKKEEWRIIKSRIVTKYGLALTAIQLINEIVFEMDNL